MLPGEGNVKADEPEELRQRVAELERLLENSAAAWVKASALTPWKDNPRDNEAAVERVAKSIQDFGFATPLVGRRVPLRDSQGHARNGAVIFEIIAGHTRVKALLSLLAKAEERDQTGHIIAGPRFVPLGIPEMVGPGMVPVRFMDHLSDDDAHLLALADNKLNEVATWTDTALAAQLRSFTPAQQAKSGFSAVELAALTGHYLQPFDGPGAGEIRDRGKQRFIVRVPLGTLTRAKEIVLAALKAAGLDCEVA